MNYTYEVVDQTNGKDEVLSLNKTREGAERAFEEAVRWGIREVSLRRVEPNGYRFTLRAIVDLAA